MNGRDDESRRPEVTTAVDRRRQPRDGCRPRGTAGRCRPDSVASEHRRNSVSALELATSGGRERAA